MVKKLVLLVLLASLGLAGTAAAQSAPPYGPPISLAAAKKAAAAAVAAVKAHQFVPYAIAIVDPAGRLVYFERMDNTQYASGLIAIDKARSATLFRRPTKVFADALARGTTSVLALRGAVPLQGGLPLVTNGKIIGAIGTSAGSGTQDQIVAEAGADTLR